jgi:cell wall-associated NlpC family hydrolase
MVSGSPASLEEEIADLARASANAPLAVVELGVDHGAGEPIVKGKVLTFGQARQVRRIAEAHGAAVDVAVIADPQLGLEEGWVEIAGPGVLEVWRDPAEMGHDHARQTEYLPSDGPLRLLGRTAAAQLVQGPDLSVGWVGEAGLAATDADAARRDWAERPRSQEEVAVPPSLAFASRTSGDHSTSGDMVVDAVLSAGRAQLGVPYRWGGTTPRGFDCSGLVQRILAGATGVLLPKHTGDQRHAGVRVTAAEADAGDLLFATPRSQRVGHVMLLTSPSTVLHACRTEQRVIEESLEANALRYQHQGYRRAVQLHPKRPG